MLFPNKKVKVYLMGVICRGLIYKGSNDTGMSWVEGGCRGWYGDLVLDVAPFSGSKDQGGRGYRLRKARVT